MKKIIILATLLAFAFVACKKSDDLRVPVIPPVTIPATLLKDSSAMDQTIQVPKNNQLIFSGVIYTGNVNAFQATNLRLKLKKGGDAVDPFVYLRRVRFIIEDIVPQTETKDSVSSNEFSFNNFLRNFPQYQLRGIKVYADILPSSTNGIGVDDNLVVGAQLTYTWSVNNILYTSTTPFVDGQKITFSAAPQPFSIASYADSTNPAGGIFIENQNTDGLRYAVGLSGQSGSVTSHRFLVQGQGTSAVTSLKLYSGGIFISQGTVSGGVCTITTSDPVSAGVRKFYSVVPALSVTPTSSNYDFNITLDEVKAVSTANEQKVDGTDRVGNNFTAFKTYLKIEKININTTVINDSSEEDTYQLRITNIGSSTAYFTQISYGLVWANNSSGLDTLQLKPRLICGATQPAGLWVDQNGDTAATSGFFKESTSVMTFSFTTEQSLPAGTAIIVMLKTFRKGFKHINDGFRIHPVFDAVAVDRSYKFINRGTIGLSKKLFSTSVQTASANPFFQLFAWSDGCDPAHSPVPGISSKDWLNGYLFPELSDQVWVR